MAEAQQPFWRDLYREAVMEPDPEKMRTRIAMAYQAIRRRSAQVQRDQSVQSEEKAQLDCAAYFLHLLRGVTEHKAREPRHEIEAA